MWLKKRNYGNNLDQEHKSKGGWVFMTAQCLNIQHRSVNNRSSSSLVLVFCSFLLPSLSAGL